MFGRWANLFDTANKKQKSTLSHCQDYIGGKKERIGDKEPWSKELWLPLKDETNNFVWLCDVLLLQCRIEIYVLKKKKKKNA